MDSGKKGKGVPVKRWLYMLAVAGSASSLAVAAEPRSSPSVKFIQRTMRSLTGEIRPGEKIRILFYGQSITAQAWSRKVAANLKKQFPDANLKIKNKAIGGFTSPALRRATEHDLYRDSQDVPRTSVDGAHTR